MSLRTTMFLQELLMSLEPTGKRKAPGLKQISASAPGAKRLVHGMPSMT